MSALPEPPWSLPTGPQALGRAPPGRRDLAVSPTPRDNASRPDGPARPPVNGFARRTHYYSCPDESLSRRRADGAHVLILDPPDHARGHRDRDPHGGDRARRLRR